MGMLPITKSASDELLIVSTSMIEKLGIAIFGCSAHFKNELQRNGWRETDSRPMGTGTAIGFRAVSFNFYKCTKH